MLSSCARKVLQYHTICPPSPHHIILYTLYNHFIVYFQELEGGWKGDCVIVIAGKGGQMERGTEDRGTVDVLYDGA